MNPTHAPVYAALAALFMAGVTLRAQGRGHDKHEAKTEVRYTDGAQIHVVFSTYDTTVIREHYRPQQRSLPPGLQKKFARTGQLPPGWQKKMTPLPVALERRLEPLPAGYHRGVFEGHAVIYRPGGLIIDATVIF